MAKIPVNIEEPRVPEGPTVPPAGGYAAAGETSSAPLPAGAGGEMTPEPGPAGKTNRGGRKPWDELAEENRILAQRVQDLRQALEPFTRLPDDPAKPADAVLYVLARHGAEMKLTCGQIRAAVKASAAL
jgi:hypothetical protein